ncbi:hypothetical protein ABZ419_11290 [Streptomyces cinnamoneus]|uniref:hypothetical protein n=1 Tax=Streptomyces cinnamoneus TaxID=53446 RepID=UPI0033E681C6
MTRPLIRPHELLQAAILGALASGLVQAIVWLATGDTPPLWAVAFGGPVVAVAVDLLIDVRRRREQQKIRDAFERPSFSEDA